MTRYESLKRRVDKMLGDDKREVMLLYTDDPEYNPDYLAQLEAEHRCFIIAGPEDRAL